MIQQKENLHAKHTQVTENLKPKLRAGTLREKGLKTEVESLRKELHDAIKTEDPDGQDPWMRSSQRDYTKNYYDSQLDIDDLMQIRRT